MNKREIKMIVVIAVLLITVLILAIILILGLGRKNNSEIESSAAPTTTTQSVAESAATTATSAAPLYILGEWDGKLAVFTMPQADTPSKVYDVFLSSLPAEEQKRLKTGIPVYDERTLQGLLEDYTS